ncbi:HAD-IG family 5'-nucleotidase [bacterium]|nr:HAD-IG family 5'-nucleotidase [bacterium]
MTETNYPIPPVERGIFCNRTLNLRSIKAIGYDMDYTLIHYHPDAWEEQAYLLMKEKLGAQGWPVEDLEYDHELIVRGLIVDVELGNLIKTNRFGYVKRAFHGTQPLSFDEQRDTYSRTLVELDDPRFYFLNTLFSLSEACMFAQMVDKFDRGELPKVRTYAEMRKVINKALDEAHTEGVLKGKVLEDPDSYIAYDPEIPQALLDQKQAGKKLVLITNSEWAYTKRVMEFAFNPYLPEGMTWRDLFKLIIVSARKPSFFNDPNPAFEIINEEGQLQPIIGGLQEGKMYVGGNATQVERLWKLAGEEILYVGDHIYADVTVSKNVLRWRTALIIREVEEELASLEGFQQQQAKLSRLMLEKETLEYQYNRVRLDVQRARKNKGTGLDQKALQAQSDELRNRIQEIDAAIGPLARASGELMNGHWGLIMRAGNDKSHLSRQVESYADIYMSRVSNFLHLTPFAYLRSPRSSLPHDETDGLRGQE